MKKYNIKNQVHFVTVDTHKKMKIFDNENLYKIIIDNLIFYKKKFFLKLFGYVIMQNHIHLLIQLSEKYNNISKIMQDFKSHSARDIIDLLKEENSKKLFLFRVRPEPLLGSQLGSEQRLGPTRGGEKN